MAHNLFERLGKLQAFEALASDPKWQALLIITESKLSSISDVSGSENKLYQVDVVVNGHVAQAILDTGAQIGVMSVVLAKKLGIYDKIDFT